MRCLRFPMLDQPRQQCLQCVLDVADQTKIKLHPSAELITADVHLDDLGLGRIELLVGEVGAEHQQGVAVAHRPIAGGESDQPGHPDVVRVVVFHILLATQRMHDRSRQRLGHLDQLVVGARRAGAGQDGDSPALVEDLGDLVEFGTARHDRRVARDDGRHPVRDRLGQRHIARDHQHRDIAVLDRRPDRQLQHPGHLLRLRNQLRIAAAVVEEFLRMSLLEVVAADLRARDLRGDRQYRHSTAMGVVETVDQVQVAWSATARTDGELPGDRGLTRRRECRRFLVPDQSPVDAADLAQRIGQPVE